MIRRLVPLVVAGTVAVASGAVAARTTASSTPVPAGRVAQSTAAATPTNSGPTTPAPRAPHTLTLATDAVQITAGNRPVLSGRVTDSSGAPVARTSVTIHRKGYGESTYATIASLTTDDDGRYALVVSPMTQTAFVARAGDVTTPALVIRVHARIAVTRPQPGAAVPSRVTFTGELLPGYPGAAMGLAVIRDGRYTFLGQGTVDSRGRWAITASLPPGTHAYVVYTSAHAGTLYGSKSLTLTV